MATVYLAYDRKHDRPVAVKVLRPELAASRGAARFLQEIRFLRCPLVIMFLRGVCADAGQVEAARQVLEELKQRWAKGDTTALSLA